jgi:hypothetical protein
VAQSNSQKWEGRADTPFELLGKAAPAPGSAAALTLVLKGSLTLTEYLEVGCGVPGAEGVYGERTREGGGGSASSSSPSSGEEVLSCLFVGRSPEPGGDKAARFPEL